MTFVDAAEMSRWTEALIRLARDAGRGTLQFLGHDCPVEWKADGNGPVTAADRVSHERISRGLRALTPDIPIVSEEGEIPDYRTRVAWQRFWLVDPLDGTKEFLNGSGEFTVNLALIDGLQPVVGVVFAPALDLLYAADRDRGAWKHEGSQTPRRIYSSNWRPGLPARVVESRSHPSAALDAFLDSIEVVDRVPRGSSLKFCAVAEGAADLYPRFGPMMEWDAAAGDCVYRYSTAGEPRPSPIRYNQPDLRIDGFVMGSDELVDLVAVSTL
jgi:3'(2'), 5'-bisphosphate nucleotidase